MPQERNQNTHKAISQKVLDVCHNAKVHCLYAIESGSRAWGFASCDSDYDVRLIYCQKPNDYLQLYPNKDTFEFIDHELFLVPFDIGGWDIKKALQLLYKSNAVIFEWLNSPIVYHRDDEFLGAIQAIYQDFVNPRAIYHHYQGMAKTAYQHLDVSKPIKLKTWFYLLRALLASDWVITHHRIPPVNITPLLDKFTQKAQILELITQKETMPENQLYLLPNNLQTLTLDLYQHCQNRVLPTHQGDIHLLNRLFQQVIETQIQKATLNQANQSYADH